MSINYSPTIARDGLVVYLDAANPKSYPGNLGAELVTTSTVTQIDGTTFNVIRDAGQNITLSLCNVESGKTYYVDYLITSYTGIVGASFRINNSGANLTPTIGVGSTGRFNAKFTASASGGLTISGDNSGTNFLVDYVSVREVLSGTGSTWFDLSSRRLNGQVYNGTTYGNNTFTFDGTNDYIGLPSPSSRWNWTPGNLANSNEYSFEMWVNSSDTSGFYFSKPWNGFGEYNYSSQHNSWFTTVGNQSHTQNFTSLATGTWQHVVFIVNATQKAVYRNGVIDAAFINHSITNVTPTSANQNQDLAIMTLYPYGESAWNQPTHAIAGSMAVFRAYNTVLTAEQIARNYQALRGRFGV